MSRRHGLGRTVTRFRLQRLSRLQRRIGLRLFVICRLVVRAIRTCGSGRCGGGLRANFTRFAAGIDRFCRSDSLFHFFAGLERHDVFRFDLDRFAGPWVSGLAGLPLAHFKHAELTQLDTPFGRERVDDGVEGPLDDVFGFELGEFCPLGDQLYDFFFCHENRPPDDCATNAIPNW